MFTLENLMYFILLLSFQTLYWFSSGDFHKYFMKRQNFRMCSTNDEGFLCHKIEAKCPKKGNDFASQMAIAEVIAKNVNKEIILK